MELNELEVEDVEEIVETKDEFDNDTTDWKALALKNQGISKRFKTKLEKAKELLKTNTDKKPEAPVVENKQGFDYAEKAYLKTSGILIEEYPFVEEVMESTGKSLDEVLEAKYFQSELKERRDLKASKDAIPTGGKRSGSAARDSVEYWVAKGELPPVDQRELRTQVLNARIKTEQSKSQFTDNPIV